MIEATPFRRALLRWFDRNGRDLPWRRTRDPYAILVSELMLQQTQVATVLPYYNRWLERFPDFEVLARALENDVLHAWQGLGYYARARNLHQAARVVQDRFGGTFPRDVEIMQEIPGIGRYTAHAVATFAFDASVPIVEANTARLLARLFNMREPIDSARGREALWTDAARLVPKTRPGRFNSALMDLGARVCSARRPKCSVCPVKTFCRALRPESLPVKRPRLPTRTFVERHALVVRQNKILLQQCTTRWRGMWMLPPLTTAREHGRFNQSGLSSRPVHTAAFPFTNHRITLRVYATRAGRGRTDRQRWFSLKELARIPVPSPHRRALHALLH